MFTNTPQSTRLFVNLNYVPESDEIMKTPLLVLSLLLISISGCGKPYVPKEMTEEEKTYKVELEKFQSDFQKAMSTSGDYVQIVVADPGKTFPDYDDLTYTSVLVLHREQLDLDDYGLSPPGKEMSEADEDYIEGFFDRIFWVDKQGNVIFDDYDQPPGTEMVVEWCIPHGSGDEVSLHFGGNPCVTLQLGQK